MKRTNDSQNKRRRKQKVSYKINNMKKAKISVLAVVLALMIVFAVGCNEYVCSVNWISPMLSIQTHTQAQSTTPITNVWDSDYELHRTTTNNFVFRKDGVESAITETALVAGGAVRTTVNFAYEGDGSYYIRFVAFAYEFFDHGRADVRLRPAAAHTAGIFVFWKNPANGQFFNIIQHSIGSDVSRGSTHTIPNLTNPNATVPVITLTSENAADFNEMELFIVALSRPTRDTDFNRSGYKITLAVEMPDWDNHFHGWEFLVSTSTGVVFTEK